MNKTIYEVKSVELQDFNPKASLTKLKINYLKNTEQKQIVKDFDLSNPVAVVNSIIVSIKAQDKIIIEESDDFLQNIFIVRIKDQEEVEEKLLSYFQSLNKSISQLKSFKIASQYMQLYNKLKLSKMVLDEFHLRK
jgi:hypothetical protein